MCLKYCCMYGKQCIPWSDTAFCCIWTGSTLFANAYLSQYLGLLLYSCFYTSWELARISYSTVGFDSFVKPTDHRPGFLFGSKFWESLGFSSLIFKGSKQESSAKLSSFNGNIILNILQIHYLSSWFLVIATLYAIHNLYIYMRETKLLAATSYLSYSKQDASAS